MTVLREAPVATLATLSDEWDVKHSTWGGPLSQIALSLDASEPTMKFGDHEVAASKQGIAALAHHIGVPPKFAERVMPDERQWILSRRIERHEEENISITFTDAGIQEIWPSGQRRIHPGEIVQEIFEVMPGESFVRDAILTTDVMRVDLYVPDGHALIGGDKKVGDITHGGLRVGMDRKHNLAPWVQPIIYRLRCTNGMEIPDHLLRIDSRGMDEMEVLGSLRQEMRRALDRVMGDIEAFYELRNQEVGKDQTGVLRRMALDAGLPARTVGRLEDALPSSIEEGQVVTMFDLTNVITNLANSVDPGSSTFRNLQIAGGSVISDHDPRCTNCHQKVGV